MRKKLFGLFLLALFIQCSDEDMNLAQPFYFSDFFRYEGTNSELNDLFLYLKQENSKSPFIEQFQKEFGNPIWNNMTSISDHSSNSLYIPVVISLQQKEIRTIWYFHFEKGYVVYHPLQRDAVKNIDAESVWMFDYFTQTSLGKKTKDKHLYTPQKHSLKTKGWQEVITCVDSYVDVGGCTEYKGSHCWSSGVEFIPDPNSKPEEIVIPGSGAGSYAGKIPPDAIFVTYPYLTSIYGKNSTLPSTAKMLLNAALSEFHDRSPYFAKMYNELCKRGIQIDFQFKEYVLPSGEKAKAFFSKEGKRIYFLNQNAITESNLEEELIHAIQYFQFYGETMDKGYKNYEFEAKLCRDLAILMNDCQIGLPPYSLTYTDPRDSFSDSYHSFIDDILSVHSFTGMSYSPFYDLCKEWSASDYPGVCSTSIEPKLLKYYFPKQQPQ